MEHNIYNEELTPKVIIKYAVIYPLGLIALCMVAEILNRL